MHSKDSNITIWTKNHDFPPKLAKKSLFNLNDPEDSVSQQTTNRLCILQQVACAGNCQNPWKCYFNHPDNLRPTKLMVAIRYLCSSPGAQKNNVSFHFYSTSVLSGNNNSFSLQLGPV